MTMNHRHHHENRYCNHCQRTTRHEVKEASFSCQQCGSIKHPPRVFRTEQAGMSLGFGRLGGYGHAV